LQDELSSISALVDRLESAASSLPYVSADGSSECPFAENSYVEKEELETEVSGRINVLTDYVAQLDDEVRRCQGELTKIEVDHAKLKHREPQAHYGDAVRHARDSYQRAQDDRDAVSVVLIKAKAVLAMSKSRVFPGRKPQRQCPAAAGTAGNTMVSQPRTGSASPATPAGNEIGGLIGLGPLGAVSPPRRTTGAMKVLES
jgi:hypothetical protein